MKINESEMMMNQLNNLFHFEERYTCPITLQLIHDPVYISNCDTEHVMYERSAIEKWLNNNHRTNPMTNVKLTMNSQLLTNVKYSEELQEYKQKWIESCIHIVRQSIECKFGLNESFTLIQIALQNSHCIDTKMNLMYLRIQCFTQQQPQPHSVDASILLRLELIEFQRENNQVLDMGLVLDTLLQLNSICHNRFTVHKQFLYIQCIDHFNDLLLLLNNNNNNNNTDSSNRRRELNLLLIQLLSDYQRIGEEYLNRIVQCIESLDVNCSKQLLHKLLNDFPDRGGPISLVIFMKKKKNVDWLEMDDKVLKMIDCCDKQLQTVFPVIVNYLEFRSDETLITNVFITLLQKDPYNITYHQQLVLLVNKQKKDIQISPLYQLTSLLSNVIVSSPQQQLQQQQREIQLLNKTIEDQKRRIFDLHYKVESGDRCRRELERQIEKNDKAQLQIEKLQTIRRNQNYAIQELTRQQYCMNNRVIQPVPVTTPPTLPMIQCQTLKSLDSKRVNKTRDYSKAVETILSFFN